MIAIYDEEQQAKTLETVLKQHMGNVEKGIFDPKDFIEDMDKIPQDYMNPYKCVTSLLELSKTKISGTNNYKVMHNVEGMIDVIMNRYTIKRPGISEVLFFPNKENELKLIQYIKMAQKTLHIAMFTITNDNLSEALLECHLRGVHIKIITDDVNVKMKGSDIPDLTKEGILIRTDNNPHALMHNKYVIIDERILVTGSYNWTAQATKMNQENVVILENEELAQKFLKEFEVLWKKFEPQNLVDHFGKEIKKTKLYLRYLSNIKKQDQIKHAQESLDDDDDEEESSGSKSKTIISSSKKISKIKKPKNVPLLPKEERQTIEEKLQNSPGNYFAPKSGFVSILKGLLFLMYFFSLYAGFTAPGEFF